MPAGNIIIPNLAKLNLFNATNLLAANPANFHLVLLDNTFNHDDATDEVLADLSGEIANGNGYTTGGEALTGVTLTQTAGVVTFDADPIVWTASGGPIPAWRYGYFYYLGTLNFKVNPLLGHFLGDNTPADIPATTNGNTLTVTPNAAGIIFAS